MRAYVTYMFLAVCVVMQVMAAPEALVPARAMHGGAAFVRKLYEGEPVTIVTLGTSLTGGDWRWPDVMMHDWLNKEFPGQVTFKNLGVGGSASSHPQGRCGLDRVNQAVRFKPDVVFIEFAVNDSYLPYAISLEAAKTNLNSMIDTILNANPETEIILQTMNPVMDNLGTGASGVKKRGLGPHATNRPGLAEYMQGYRDVAKQRALLLVDHYPNWLKVMNENPELFDKLVPDRIHPRVEGYRMVLLPELRKTLMPVFGDAVENGEE